jgi:hypothetical protein
MRFVEVVSFIQNKLLYGKVKIDKSNDSEDRNV